MAIRGKVTELEMAYIAGLFDGEGHVFITRDIRKAYKNPLHILRTGITNTHRDTVQWLFDLFPTTISHRVRNKNHSIWKPCYFWEASSKNALVFLKIIYPFLKIKKEQVKLAIEFQETWQDRRYRDSKGRVCATLPEIVEKREWYRQTITELNKKKYPPAETKRDCI